MAAVGSNSSLLAAMLALLSWVTLASSLLFVKPSDFGCTSTNIDDRARYTFLNAHNEARLSLALGTEPGVCGNLTSGKNVHKLSWDCDLEDKINANIATCSMSTPAMAGVSYNIAYMSGVFPNPISNLATLMTDWWSEGRTVALTQPGNIYPGTAMYRFANMANGKATGMACSYKICGALPSQMVFACYYNSQVYTASTVYEEGPPCAADGDCITYPQSSCQGGLCFKALEIKDTGANTVCPSNPNMTDASRQKFVDMHNYLKSRGVRGLEADAIGGGFAPKGSKSLKYKYDCAIEATAQSWANGCNFAHSAPAQRVHGGIQSGENMWMTSALNMEKVASAAQASQLWWDELKQYGVGPSNNLTQALWDRPLPSQIGHYTQMAWGPTYKLGCGIAYCSSMTFGVCQYGPAGNYMNTLVYALGEPCSACAAGQTCDPAEGLCVVP